MRDAGISVAGSDFHPFARPEDLARFDVDAADFAIIETYRQFRDRWIGAWRPLVTDKQLTHRSD